MATIDYKEKYEQALERASKLHDNINASSSRKAWLEDIFPELKESEGERIRKALLEMVHDTTGDELWVDYNVHKEDALACLEKLGKQKLNPVLDIEIPLGAKDSELQEASYYIPEGFHAEIEGNRVVIKRGEQKPAVIIPKFRIGDYVKNVNDKREPIYEIVYMDKECYVCEYRGKENMGDKAVMHFSFDYPYLRHTQNTVWGEEDEINLEKAIWYVENPATMVVKDSMLVEWLKNLRGRVQPRTNQELCEDDSEHLDSIIESYKDLIADYKACHDVDYIPYDSNTVVRTVTNDVNFLESLKDRYTWKPSKEMLEALYRATPQNTMAISEDEMLLDKLYQGLKYGRVLSKN